MTEFEQQLIAKLTTQLDVHNKIELKKMQNESLWEDKLSNAEIEHIKAKTKFYNSAADLVGIIAILIAISAILIGIGVVSGLGACASIF